MTRHCCLMNTYVVGFTSNQQNLTEQQKPERPDSTDIVTTLTAAFQKEAEGVAHMQLVVNVGSVLQQGLHHLGVSVLRGRGEGAAPVLPQEKHNNVRTPPRPRCQAESVSRDVGTPIVPSSGTRWRLRTQRAASRRHRVPAGRRRTARRSPSGGGGKRSLLVCTYFNRNTVNQTAR